MYPVVSLICVLLLASVHILNRRFLPANDRKREAIISLGSGFAIGYLFLRVLPKLAEAQPVLSAATSGGFLDYLQHHAYLVALAGFFLYFAGEQAIRLAEDNQQTDRASRFYKGFAYFHLGSLSLYFFLVGYYVTKLPEGNFLALILFSFAMLIHFSAIDNGVRLRFPEIHHHWLRWLIALATLAGWIAGMLTPIAYVPYILLNSLIAGAMLINVIQQELKHVSNQSIVFFFIGAVGYTILLLVFENML